MQFHNKLDAEILLRKVLKYCENKPTFLVDRRTYHEAFKNHGLEYRHETQNGVKPSE
ncbi:MAG: hypothetical protein H5T50_02320 [Nitrososphaeria archaeon]|nr:hypothetical protein [Nitrososphaeria archaeon]